MDSTPGHVCAGGASPRWRHHAQRSPVSDCVGGTHQGRTARTGPSHRMTFDGPSGYLRSVLDALDVPIESQIAVFARDSVQRARISAGNPRSIFFNDAVAI